MADFMEIIRKRKADGAPLTVSDLLAWCSGGETRKRLLIEALSDESLPWEILEQVVIDQHKGWGSPTEPVPEPTKFHYEPVEPDFLFRLAEEVQDKHGIPPSDPRFITLMGEELLAITSPVTVQSDDFLQWIEKNFPREYRANGTDNSLEPEGGAAAPASNSFRRDGDFWEIWFNGKKLPLIKDSVNIQAIAECLQHPGKEKQISLVHDSEPEQILDEKGKGAIQNEVYRIHNKLEEFYRKGKDDQDTIELENKLEKIKRQIKPLNATVQDNGTIKWGACLDQGEIKKQKYTHRKQLVRGVDQIRALPDGAGLELAEYLEGRLLNHNFFTPLPTDQEWFVSY